MVFSLVKKAIAHWQLFLLVILFLPLLLRLGFWQLERADEKQQLLTVYQQRRDLPAKKFRSSFNQTIKIYQTVTMQGKYEESRYWLLDNTPKGGKVGYEVVMPLRITSDTGGFWVLVNRGWIVSPTLRSVLPLISTPKNDVEIQGYFYSASKNAIFKNIESDLEQEWPKRVLQLDISNAAAILKGDVYPYILRIDEHSSGALITQWPIINTLPEKHQAYAVQWFSMALVLLLLYFWVLYNNNKKEGEHE